MGPNIIGISKSSGNTQDWITVTCDGPVDGLIFLNPALPGHIVNVDSIEGKPTVNSIIFAVPLPGSQEFPWNPGTYQLGAWSTFSTNIGGLVNFTVNAGPVMPRLTGPSTVPYLPPGIIPNAAGTGYVLADGSPIPVVHAAGPNGPDLGTQVQQAASTGNVNSTVTTNTTQASGSIQQQTGILQQVQSGLVSAESMFTNPDGSINWMYVGLGIVGLWGISNFFSGRR